MRKYCFTALSKKAWGKTYKSKINQNTDFGTPEEKKQKPIKQKTQQQQKKNHTAKKMATLEKNSSWLSL